LRLRNTLTLFIEISDCSIWRQSGSSTKK
jgi:hypothetical protein